MVAGPYLCSIPAELGPPCTLLPVWDLISRHRLFLYVEAVLVSAVTSTAQDSAVSQVSSQNRRHTWIITPNRCPTALASTTCTAQVHASTEPTRPKVDMVPAVAVGILGLNLIHCGIAMLSPLVEVKLISKLISRQVASLAGNNHVESPLPLERRPGDAKGTRAGSRVQGRAGHGPHVLHARRCGKACRTHVALLAVTFTYILPGCCVSQRWLPMPWVELAWCTAEIIALIANFEQVLGHV